MLQAVSTPNLPGSETSLLSLSWDVVHLLHIYGFITLVDKQSNSTLEFESVVAIAGWPKSFSRFRLSSVKLRNHKVGYFDTLLWAVRVIICVATFCIGGKCSVVLSQKYGGVSSLMY